MAELKLLTTPGCTHCAEVKKTINKIKPDFPELKVEIIDVTEHPEVAQQYFLMSAPGIVINGKLEFTGGVSERELRKKLKEQS